MKLDEKTVRYFKTLFWLLLGIAAMLLEMKDDSNRMYWPYMLSAYAMAVLGYVQEMQNRPAGERLKLFDFLFPQEIWGHQSTLNDFAVSIINFLLVTTVLGYFVITPDSILRTLKAVEHDLYAGKVSELAPTVAPLVVYTLLSVLLSELFYYISHRMTHEWPLLWEFHKVHHSAEVMTPLTLYRMHPVDFWLNMTFRALGLGLASLIFTYFYPGDHNVIMVANVNVLVFLTNFFGANLRHSHIWISFGPWAEHFFLSPAQHQVHHSDNPKHFDKNYGSLLSIWDWVFGSLYVTKEREHIRFGFGDEQEQSNYKTVWSLYYHPVKMFCKRLAGK